MHMYVPRVSQVRERVEDKVSHTQAYTQVSGISFYVYMGGYYFKWLGTDIFEYVSWCTHIREYTGLATTTVVTTTIVSI